VIVCLCHGVSDRDIAAAVQSGCTSFPALQEALRVATSCGRCLECAQATFESQRQHRALGSGCRACVGSSLDVRPA
jgi:bacterioferritin-associated ferredoxin